jgi:hypothetical protein
MKKNNNRGFMLVETLVVSTFIFSTLIFLYVQFRTVNNSYSATFNYNTANGLYAVNNVKEYLLDVGYRDLALKIGEEKYIDITSCPIQYISELSYCRALFEKLNIKTVIFTNQDLSELKGYLLQARPFDEDLNKFINFIKYDDADNEYRLIIAFKDDTFATLKIV